MTTRKELAELAALLATRAPTVAPSRIAADAMKLARYGASQLTNASNLCNVPDYQARYDRKRDNIKKHAQDVAGAYSLRVELSGDPRGFCLKLHGMGGNSVPVRGNTWGGDESGYGV